VIRQQVCQRTEGFGGLGLAFAMIQANTAQPQFFEQGTIRKNMMAFVKPPLPTKRATGFLMEKFLGPLFDHGFLDAGEDRFGFGQGQPQVLGQ
jgi:hypothetical protein